MLKRPFVRKYQVLICYWTLVILCSGCVLKEGNENEAANASFSGGKLKTILLEREMKGDLVPLNDSILFLALPEIVGKFETHKDEGSTFNGKKIGFSEAKRTFWTDDDSFLSITLADYTKEIKAFKGLWETFDSLGKKMPDHPHMHELQVESRSIDGFTWTYKNKQNDVWYLEVGKNYRYHLVIATNNSRSRAYLDKARNSINWKRIARENHENYH